MVGSDSAFRTSDVGTSATRTRLVVLFGGRSAEHEVSCISALNVCRSVDPTRYDLHAIGITTDGRWTNATKMLSRLDGMASALPSPDTLLGAGPVGADEVEALATITGSGSGSTNTVVLVLLHGPMGEDGTVQGLLELADVAYVGAGVTGSAVCMDKAVAKNVLAAEGLPQVIFLARRENDLGEDFVGVLEAELGWPVFVKPANLGSSVGISKAANADELNKAIALARRFDEYLVFEEAVSAREIEVGLLGLGQMRASVPGEVIPSHDFYDFEDKYLEGAAALQIPARIPDEVAAQAQTLALKAARALRVDGMARVDFLYEEAGRGLLVNEVNTIPGFTPVSMYPQLWAASGVGYGALIDELVSLALARHDRRRRFETARP